MKTLKLLLIAVASALLFGGCIWQSDGNAAVQNTVFNAAEADTQQAVSLKTRIIHGTIIDIVDNKNSKLFYLATALPQSGKPYITAIASAGRLIDKMKIGDMVEVIAETGGLENNLAQCRFIRKISNPD